MVGRYVNAIDKSEIAEGAITAALPVKDAHIPATGDTNRTISPIAFQP